MLMNLFASHVCSCLSDVLTSIAPLVALLVFVMLDSAGCLPNVHDTMKFWALAQQNAALIGELVSYRGFFVSVGVAVKRYQRTRKQPSLPPLPSVEWTQATSLQAAPDSCELAGLTLAGSYCYFRPDAQLSPPALHVTSLKISPGEFWAITGETGPEPLIL